MMTHLSDLEVKVMGHRCSGKAQVRRATHCDSSYLHMLFSDSVMPYQPLQKGTPITIEQLDCLIPSDFRWEKCVLISVNLDNFSF